MGINEAFEYYKDNEELIYFERLKDIKTFKEIDEIDIKSTSYVVDTLEASLWCLLNHSSYRESVMHAVNLGDDTDTVAAICGGLAGIYYGYDDIPRRWLSVVRERDFIKELCETIGKS